MQIQRKLEVYKYYIDHVLEPISNRKRPIKDHLTNRNPLGTPPVLRDLIREAVEKQVYEKYYNITKLTRIIAEFENVCEQNVQITNGASQAILNIITQLKPKTAIIQDLTYLDYVRICTQLNIEIRYFNTVIVNTRLLPDYDKILENLRKADQSSTLILVNPNNPTGKYIPQRELTKIIEECYNRNIYVIVDISFIDFQSIETHSMIRRMLEFDNVILVKSYTKIFACPGVRIGAVFSNFDKIRIVGQRWPISSIDAYAFEKFLGEHADYARKYIENTRRYVQEETRRVVYELRKLGIEAYDSDVHFFVMMCDKYIDEDLYLRYGIAIRRYCETREKYKMFRISIGRREDNDYLVTAISELVCAHQ